MLIPILRYAMLLLEGGGEPPRHALQEGSAKVRYICIKAKVKVGVFSCSYRVISAPMTLARVFWPLTSGDSYQQMQPQLRPAVSASSGIRTPNFLSESYRLTTVLPFLPCICIWVGEKEVAEALRCKYDRGWEGSPNWHKVYQENSGKRG